MAAMGVGRVVGRVQTAMRKLTLRYEGNLLCRDSCVRMVPETFDSRFIFKFHLSREKK